MLAFFYQGQVQTDGGYSILMIVGMFAIMYFLLIRPQMKQQKAHRSMVDNLKAGDKVIAAGGIHGEIDHLDSDRVCLKVAEKTKIFVSRGSVSAMQGSPQEEKK